jgi:hypothetical protein
MSLPKKPTPESHRGGGERQPTERSSRLMLPASAAMWGMLSLGGGTDKG